MKSVNYSTLTPAKSRIHEAIGRSKAALISALVLLEPDRGLRKRPAGKRGFDSL